MVLFPLMALERWRQGQRRAGRMHQLSRQSSLADAHRPDKSEQQCGADDHRLDNEDYLWNLYLHLFA